MKVSVIIPCYQCQKTIEKAIDSVLDQDYHDLEIILVDNGSTDSTWEIIQNYSITFPDKIKIYKENKQGANFARNNGLHHSNGQWIQFLDADDWLDKDKISHQVLLSAQKDRLGIVIGAYVFHYLSTGKNFQKQKTMTPIDNLDHGLITSQFGLTSSILWNKDAIINAGKWNPELYCVHEYDLMHRITLAGYDYLTDHDSKTHVNFLSESASRSDSFEKTFRIIKDRVKFRFELGLKNSQCKDLANSENANEIFSEILIRDGEALKSFRILAKEYQLKISIKDRIQKYRHYIISQYVNTDRIQKYFQFIFFASLKINRLFRRM